MIHLLHGDNITKSYSRLQELKEHYGSTGLTSLEIDANKATLTTWKDFISSDQLFEEDFLIIYNLFANKDLSIDDILAMEKNIIIYEKKKLDRPPVGKGINVEKFDLEQALYKFVECLVPGNSSICLKYYQQSLLQQPWELIFSMIVRQFRLMLYSKAINLPKDSQWDKIADWQKQKIRTQSAKFSLERLKLIYRRLLEIDVLAKTSQDSQLQLELLLISL